VSKSRQLGWRAKRDLETYIKEFISTHKRGNAREKRVLVFSTTFFPVQGLAEEVFVELMRQMPDVQFDIVTTAFSREARKAPAPTHNAHIHRVGYGTIFDKYLLPILGYRVARRLHRKHQYLFAWSLMASYAALAGVFSKRLLRLPLLITLADQDLESVSSVMKLPLRFILTDADQVYGAATQESAASAISARTSLRSSIGEGDAFANQLRYSYVEILRLRGIV
jgi:hypothetical protein